jgi:hypothetical protein
MLGAQAVLHTNILSRDGNCIARIIWLVARNEVSAQVVVQKGWQKVQNC